MTVSGAGRKPPAPPTTTVCSSPQQAVAQPQLRPKLNVSGPAPTPELAPRTILTPRMTPAMRINGPAYAEIVARLEPQIVAQMKAVQAVMVEEKLEPEDVGSVYAFDITGETKVRCAYCGRPGCGYRPTAYASKNVEIDLLEDSLVVYLEVMRRLGGSFGAVVYDEEVLVLRELDKPNPDEAGDVLLSRYRAFRDRKVYPDSTSREWMAEMLAKWRPEMTSMRMTGDASDLGALKVSEVMLSKFEGEGLKGIMVSKSTIPQQSLKAQETILHSKDIEVVGVAVGRNAATVAPQMFKDTDAAVDLHVLREKIGERLTALIDKSLE